MLKILPKDITKHIKLPSTVSGIQIVCGIYLDDTYITNRIMRHFKIFCAVWLIVVAAFLATILSCEIIRLYDGLC